MTVCMVAGDFGRPHEGHFYHILKASLLGDKLIVVTHTDESIIERKKYKPMPLEVRMTTLRGWLKDLKIEGRVVLAEDTDGKCVETLKKYKPNIFAKGGGYTLDTLPQEEVELCEQLGIRIVLNVGDRLAESRQL
jgi:D-beta-D-heptose 7-phosphate kinase/D-beta-D-heptose 1-phosphate adenosyltransferase